MLVAARFRWKRWSKISIGTGVCFAVVAGLIAIRHNPVADAGVPVIGRVVEIKPKVDGLVIAVPIEPNVLVHKESVLLQIDPAPYQARLRQVKAKLAAARRTVERLKNEVADAESTLVMIQAQYNEITGALGQLQHQPEVGTATEFRLLYMQDTRELLASQLRMAKEQLTTAREAFAVRIDSANLSAAGLTAQLADARSQFDQATVRAPIDGYVSRIDVAVGGRAVTTRSVVSLIPADEITDRQRFLAGGTATHTARHGHKSQKTFANQFRAWLR